MPRAYVVSRVHSEPDFQSALRHIWEDDFQPLREAVIVGDRRLDEPSEAAPTPDEAVGWAKIVRYAPEQVELAAECAGACLLVLTDLYYPGWQAYVDGREAEIQRTNAIFRGVRLEPGSHRVVYRYAPASFRNGLLVLLAAVIAVAAGLLALGVGTKPEAGLHGEA